MKTLSWRKVSAKSWVRTLAAEYGVAADEDLLVTNSDVVMGNIGAAGKLLGGLYGMQISVLGAGGCGRGAQRAEGDVIGL